MCGEQGCLIWVTVQSRKLVRSPSRLLERHNLPSLFLLKLLSSGLYLPRRGLFVFISETESSGPLSS